MMAQLTTWARILLWFIVEIALIGADIQEVSGSAIALQILTCAFLPIWPLDFISREVLNEETRRSFCGLIATMPLSFSWMFNETKRSGQELFIGILVPDNLTSCWSCWIVFLHSALVQLRKTNPKDINRVQEALNYNNVKSSAALFLSFMINLMGPGSITYRINMAARVFPILYIWGIGLLAAGQRSTITGTYAGQFIMEGFLDLLMEQWLSAFLTRSFASVPTISYVNTSEGLIDVLNEWLNILQSMQIPFAVIPLLTMVSKQHIMGPLLEVCPFFSSLFCCCNDDKWVFAEEKL
ncbi:LOW QUALITY PROTEIN: hypothetical protein HID58_094867, partial [Brassica napus]